MPITIAALAALLVEAALYGAYTVLLSLCLWAISRGTSQPRLVLFAACASYLLSTAYFSLDIYSIVHAANSSNPAETIHADNRLSTAMNFILVLNAVLGETILIWRCFRIWNRKYLIIIPSLILMLLMSVCGFTCVFGETMTQFPELVYTGLASAISTHLMTTAVLAFKISSYIRSTIKAFGRQAGYQDHYQRILVTVVVTGIIYTAGGLVIIALVASVSPGLMILLSSASQTVGIIPALTILGTAFAQFGKVAPVHRSSTKTAAPGVVVECKKVDCEAQSSSSQNTITPAEGDLSETKEWQKPNSHPASPIDVQGHRSLLRHCIP